MAAQKNDSDVVIKANWKHGFLNDSIINRLMNTRLRLLLTTKFANIHEKLVRNITLLEILQGKAANYTVLCLMMVQSSSHVVAIKLLPSHPPLLQIKL